MRPGAEAPGGRGGPPGRVSHGRRQVKAVRTRVGPADVSDDFGRGRFSGIRRRPSD